MKEKPFYLGLDGCDSEVTVTVHGLSTSLDTNLVSLCLYEKGGKEIGCQDTAHHGGDDDAEMAKFAVDFESQTTVFANQGYVPIRGR